jgi:hypothetical protein
MGQNFTYPDGSTLTSSALTLQQISAMLQPIVCGMLGVTDPSSTSMVRISYPTQGAPFQDVADDVVYINCKPKDDPYDRIRDRASFSDPDNPILNEERWNYTRAWAVHLCFYGPSSLDRARAVRSAFYQDYFTEELAQLDLFPIPDAPPPVRVPEELNGQWFERCDFEADLYEFVTETITRQTVKSVEVIVEEPAGEVADFTVVGS